jgi:hypothetical protein
MASATVVSVNGSHASVTAATINSVRPSGAVVSPDECVVD